MKRVLVIAAVGMCLVIFAAAARPAAAQDGARFYVIGFVKTPGSFQHRSGMTVQQGIAIAGGLTERGSARGVRISRLVDGQSVELDVTLSDPVQPNDTIKVRQRLQ